jgi:hypothetical protein
VPVVAMALTPDNFVQPVEAAPSMRSSKATRSGLPILGDLFWGSHFCHFYETTSGLADCLVPYFKAGLDSGEACF